ncbi:condensation domain-containing protein [Kitasatospora sp. NPDC127059]|uniref:condensation domain-containing protein n=1 Tax=unclassified Kitasatospora TaxID=2633591 RepID=UPI0036666B41
MEKSQSIAELLWARAEEQPDRLGYSFLLDGESQEIALSYAELDRKARVIAAGIRETGVRPGARVMLLMPPGFDYVAAFFGCLYAGAVAVPAYPPNPMQLERTLPRLLAVVRDADPAVALTISPLLDYFRQVPDLPADFLGLRWLSVDDLPAPQAGAGDPVVVDPDTTAVLQYTSGSTSTPKGVMLSHTNLLHNLGLIRGFFGTSESTRALIWLPPYHDMGLIGGLLQPLYAGCPVTLMSPLHFLERPMRWLETMHRQRATISGGPNFAYELCARKATPEQIAGLDLSAWEVAFNGAEPIRPETLQRFARTFAPTGFRADAFLSCYGLAEATLIVSGRGGRSVPARAAGPEPVPEPVPVPGTGPVVRVDGAALGRHLALPAGDGPVVDLTNCGSGAGDQLIAIVDPVTSTPCPPERVGEIWVSGPSVAQGYWGRPAESAEVFRARIVGQDDRGFLRTGDLGFLHDGELVVTGRLKDLIIVRGRNHYPQDIEQTAERADPALRRGCTAAFQLPDAGSDEHLVVVHEVQPSAGEVDLAAVAARVRRAVAGGHGLQVHTVVLIRAGGIPKTSSGKIQRRLCRTRLLAGELPVLGSHAAGAADTDASPTAEQVLAAAPGERAVLLEGHLRGRIASLVGADPAELSPAEPLLAAGLDSLGVVQLKHGVESELGVELSMAALLGGATLADTVEQLADRLAAPGADRPATAPVAGTGGDPTAERVVPMSPGQRWIWLTQNLEPESTAYTIAVALRVHGSVDRPALRRALDAVVARHPALRTTFAVRGGEPSQLVHPHARAEFREHEAPGGDDEALSGLLRAALRRPFDLEAGPLLRLDLYRHTGGEVILLTAHHIVTDFWSSTILAEELGAYYTAFAAHRELTLPPPRAGYPDVVEWRRSVLADPAAVARLDAYWARQLPESVPRLTFPAVDPASTGQGGARAFSLPAELTGRLRAVASAEKATMYVLLLAAFETALHRATGQDEIVVGAALAGRSRPEFADVVGCCTYSAMMRSRVTGEESFRALLARTREQVIGALEHQDYPLSALSERLGTGRRGSLVEALFAFNRSPRHGDDLAALVTLGPAGIRRSLGGLEVEAFPLPFEEGTLPLELVMAEADGRLHGLLRHRAGFLDEPGAERLLAWFTAVLERVADDPGTPLGELLRPTRADHRES